MNIATIEAIAQLREQRDALLAQVATTARAAARAKMLWDTLGASVAADGNIGSVWTEAEAANAELITALGASVPRVLTALAEMQAAAVALQAAGEALDPPLNLLGVSAK